MTPLHHVGESLRIALSAIPLPWVRVLFVLALVVVLVWVVRLPADVTTPPGGARRWDENLKVGAILALLIQIAIYCLL